MDVIIVSGDPLFAAAVEAIAGAMGHRARRGGPSEFGCGVTVWDAATAGPLGLLGGMDPLRTAVFVAERDDGGAVAEVWRFLHVHPRTALATELPGVLAVLADSPGVW